MKEKLLILDDDLPILSSLEHLFEDDYEVFATFDGQSLLPLKSTHVVLVRRGEVAQFISLRPSAK